MTYPIIYAPARNCVQSDLNVRTESDPVADAELEAMIGKAGFVLQNLIGAPIGRKKDHYGIFGGGRRLAGVHRLIEKGKLPEDFCVPVMVLPNAKDAIELSLAENQRLPMSPADECLAFKNMIEKEGKTVAEVAARMGKSERFVLGRRRLADLDEIVFEALRKGEITLQVAMAYAATTDTVRQRRVFEELSPTNYRDDVDTIREAIASGCYRGGDPKALFVGRDAYVEAGGRIDRDLYSDDETEMWIDGNILDGLAEEKLVAEAEAIRRREGLAEIRAVPATRVVYAQVMGLQPVHGEQPPLTAEQEARREEIQAEIQAIEATANHSPDGDDEARYRELRSEIHEIEKRAPVVSVEQKASALAYVVLGEDGQPRLHEQLYAAPGDLDAKDQGNDNASCVDDDVIESAAAASGASPSAISKRLSHELAMMKAELLRIHIASDPRFALDLGTFIMVDCALQSYVRSSLASELSADAAPSLETGFESGALASQEWAKLEAGLDRSWADPKLDVIGRYEAFCAIGDEARAAWLGWVIARTMRAVPAGDAGDAFIDHLGRKLEIDVAAWWRPTAKNYFKRLGRPAILDLFEEIGGSELRQRYGASKKELLASSAEQLFAGNIVVEADIMNRAIAWLPGAMRFDDPVDDPANHRETAETDALSVGETEGEDTDTDFEPPIADAA